MHYLGEKKMRNFKREKISKSDSRFENKTVRKNK